MKGILRAKTPPDRCRAHGRITRRRRGKGVRSEWHCRLSCQDLRRAFGDEFGAGCGAGEVQELVRLGPAFDGAGFYAVRSVADEV